MTDLPDTFYYWLYQPYDEDIDMIIKYYHTQPIPDIVFVTKLVCYCKTVLKMSIEETEAFLQEKGFSLKDLESAYSMEEHNHTPSNIMKYCNIPSVRVPHDKYPEVDPELGRARIGYLACYHTACSFVGINNNELREHLKKCKSYIPYFHTTHETTVEVLELTPEEVLSEGMTSCPSPICDQKSVEMTPEELVQHFALLGIKPFWEPNMKFDYISNLPTVDITTEKPILKSKNKCLICYKKEPQVLFLNCQHHISCIKCFQGSKKCPICRIPIKYTVAY